jgi:hypothetical protein
MYQEAAAAALIGIAVLYFVLRPLVHPGKTRPPVFEPLDPEDTEKGVALAALKEIEFDRETGKLSDVDYDFLKARYTARALEALRAENVATAVSDVETLIAARVRTLRSASAPAPLPGAADDHSSCLSCGPRPEADAVFCSNCGSRLPRAGTCAGCGSPLGPDSLFCEGCGARVAA